MLIIRSTMNRQEFLALLGTLLGVPPLGGFSQALVLKNPRKRGTPNVEKNSL